MTGRLAPRPPSHPQPGTAVNHNNHHALAEQPTHPEPDDLHAVT